LQRNVANSPYTVLGNSYSAGRLYDKIGGTADGTIMYVVTSGVLCYMEQKEDVDKDWEMNHEKSKENKQM